jgi:hypothetical protein
MKMTGFEALNDALNVDYDVDKEIENINAQSERFSAIRKEISDKEKNTELEDKEYLEFELKTLIANNRRVLDILEQDIKIGTKPRYHEVYATLTKSVLDGIRELRELNKTIADIKFQKEKLEVRKMQNSLPSTQMAHVNFQLTGKDLFDMINIAKRSSQLNAVDAVFEVDSAAVISEKKKINKK